MPFEKSKTYCPRQRDGSFSPPAAGIDWAMPDMSSVIEPRRRALSIAPEPVNWSEPATPGALIVAVMDMCVVETREVFVAAAATGSNDCETVSLAPQPASGTASSKKRSGVTSRRITPFFGAGARNLQFGIPRRGEHHQAEPTSGFVGAAGPEGAGTSEGAGPSSSPALQCKPQYGFDSARPLSSSWSQSLRSRSSYSARVMTSPAGGAVASTS